MAALADKQRWTAEATPTLDDDYFAYDRPESLA
jgi:hypothetical protein